MDAVNAKGELGCSTKWSFVPETKCLELGISESLVPSPHLALTSPVLGVSPGDVQEKVTSRESKTAPDCTRRQCVFYYKYFPLLCPPAQVILPLTWR